LRNNLFGVNGVFLRNLVGYFPGPVYIDEAHHKDYNLYTQGVITIKRTLPEETAREILLFIGGLMILKELSVFGYLLRPLKVFLLRFFGRKKDAREMFLEVARERGWDEVEVLEILEMALES